MLGNVISSRTILDFDREFTFFNCAGYLHKKLTERFTSTTSASQNHSEESLSGVFHWGALSSKVLAAVVLGFLSSALKVFNFLNLRYFEEKKSR